MRKLSQAEVTEIISFRLKEIRKRHKHTQDVVASNLEIDRSTYTKYETGDTIPRLPFLVKFASLYDMTLTELLVNIDMAMKEE